MRRGLTATLVTCALAAGGGSLRRRQRLQRVEPPGAAARPAPGGERSGQPARRRSSPSGSAGRTASSTSSRRSSATTTRRIPRSTIDLVGGIDDDKITAALRSGDGPDAVSSFTSSNVGAYCSSGGWIDLAPYMQQDGIDANIFPATTRTTRSTTAPAARCRSWPTPTASTTTRTCSRRPAPPRRRRPSPS